MLKKVSVVFLLFTFFSATVAFGVSSLYLLKKKRLAIVIDDMGYNEQLAEEFESLKLPLAFSFLPDAPFSHELSKQMSEDGYIVLIHMPSQPLDFPKDNPGRYAIYLWTTKAETEALLSRAYKIIPTALGLNNHMGSAILRDKVHLDYIMEFLRKHHLFFVDSYTVRDSLGCTEAEKFGVMCVRRRVFLDDIKNVDYIKGQIRVALDMLKRQNYVLAIGHCNEKTFEAIRDMKNQLKPYLTPVIFLLR